MPKDRTIVWVLEYIFGGAMVIVPMTRLTLHRFVWSYPHTWATQLFVTCLGVILISCASSMRQRMLLAKRIDELTGQIRERSALSQGSAEAKSR
ncbi:MAG: hypothetical protein P8Z79_02820 [Sedimentisphaerales bacterium]|jgi:hypothetical protein